MNIGPTRTPAERDALAARVLRLRAEGLTRKIIAERCGCGPNMVSTILREAKAKEATQGEPTPNDQT